MTDEEDSFEETKRADDPLLKVKTQGPINLQAKKIFPDGRIKEGESIWWGGVD